MFRLRGVLLYRVTVRVEMQGVEPCSRPFLLEGFAVCRNHSHPQVWFTVAFPDPAGVAPPVFQVAFVAGVFAPPESAVVPAH